ncbi:hypothetical protein Ahy_B08g091591 isoform A [Arachis hypogaea]|uniref:CASP-like protein n=1 Tax=Arachis hypogaea TaxID=3818 RepID=A0A444Y2B8_ARAHY|nr:hypothetical protein Ahy_B08g091591 isoform A [Arachis hypogaea]
MILGLGVFAAVLIGTDSQVKVVFSFEKEAKFTDVKALVFLVVANGLAAGYSLIQELRCVVSLVRGSVLFNKPLAWAIFYADQAGVGCFINCRCDTCKNTFGRKDAGVANLWRRLCILDAQWIYGHYSKSSSHDKKRIVDKSVSIKGSKSVLLIHRSDSGGHEDLGLDIGRNMLCSGLVKGKASLEKVGKRLRRSLKFEFDEFDDADLFKDESASGHGVK